MAISSEIEKNEERKGGETVIFFLILCLLLGCASRWLLQAVRERYGLRVPYSVMMMVIGMCLGVALWSEQGKESGPRSLTTLSLSQWVQIDPRLILFIFLPALIYESAMETNYYIFSKHFFSALVLAGPGMLAQSALIACCAVYILPYGWNWTESFLFGGILSATDPVAVIAILKELGVLPDLRVLIEAESLLNDGTAIVLFQICESMLISPMSPLGYVGSAMQMVIGGPALGMGLFTGSFYWMQWTLDPLEHTLITFCSSYMGFYVAEGTAIGASGVLAVVTMGIMMSGYGKTAISTEEGQHMLHSVWQMIVFCAETVIFVLAGAIIIEKGFLRLKQLFTLSDWGYLLLLYVLLALIRGVMVLLCSPYFRTFGYNLKARAKSRKDFIKCMLIVTWGGLRGAVGLMLALEVSQNESLRQFVDDKLYNERVLLHTAGMVVLTTVVNAAMMEWVITALGMSEPNDAEQQMFRGAIRFLEDKHDSLLVSLQNHLVHPQMAGVDWQAVEASVGKDKLTKPLQPREDTDKDKDDEIQPYGAEHQTQTMSSPLGRVRRMSNFMLGHWEGREQSNESNESMENDDDSVVALSVMGGPTSESHATTGMIGRYLMSLRASYTSQWNKGLMAARPYRRVVWAISRALDHAGDAVREPDCFMKFEWGWLKSEGCLRIPRWMKRLTMIPGLKQLGERLIRDEYSVQFEMVCAIIRAHDETSRCELRPTRHAEVFDRIVHDSIVLKQAAEAHLAQMEHEKPKVGMKVRTRQACCIVLTSFRERVNELHSLGQISHSEYDRLCLHLTSKLNFFTEGYPKVNQETREVHTLPIFRHIPAVAWHEEFEHLALSPVVVEKGAVISWPGSALESVKVIMHGVVKWISGPDKDDDDATEQAEEHEEYAMVAGSTFGEYEFLLSIAGYEAEWSGKAVALTEVRMYELTVEALTGLCERHPFILCQLWMRAGALLTQTMPDLFPNFPTVLTTESAFANCKLKFGAAGIKFHLRFPVMLIRGVAEHPDGSDIEPFAYLEPDDAPFIIFKEDKNAILLFPPRQEDIISRRTLMAGAAANNSQLAALEKQINELRKDRTEGPAGQQQSFVMRKSRSFRPSAEEAQAAESGEDTDYRQMIARVNSGLRQLQEAQVQSWGAHSAAQSSGHSEVQHASIGSASNLLKAAGSDHEEEWSNGDSAVEEVEVEEIVQLIQEVDMAAEEAGTEEEEQTREVKELLMRMASIAHESSPLLASVRTGRLGTLRSSVSHSSSRSPSISSDSPRGVDTRSSNSPQLRSMPSRLHRKSISEGIGSPETSVNLTGNRNSNDLVRQATTGARRIASDGNGPFTLPEQLAPSMPHQPSPLSRSTNGSNGNGAGVGWGAGGVERKEARESSGGGEGGGGSQFVALGAVPHASLLRQELSHH